MSYLIISQMIPHDGLLGLFYHPAEDFIVEVTCQDALISELDGWPNDGSLLDHHVYTIYSAEKFAGGGPCRY